MARQGSIAAVLTTNAAYTVTVSSQDPGLPQPAPDGAALRGPKSSGTSSEGRASVSTETAERWLREYGDVLWRFAISKLRSRDLAEEVVQETLLAAMEAYSRFAGMASERTWLLGIAAHKIADVLRAKRRRDRHVSHLAGEPSGSSELSSEATGGASEFTARGSWRAGPTAWPAAWPARASREEHAELMALLAACLEKLPPGISEAIWLRDLLDVPAEEVCQVLGLSATNVWTRTYRGRAALRTCMEEALTRRTSVDPRPTTATPPALSPTPLPPHSPPHAPQAPPSGGSV
jgi:RNA polymerase sigma-70 factor (ECF subfamily)